MYPLGLLSRLNYSLNSFLHLIHTIMKNNKKEIDYSLIADKETNKIEINGLFYINKDTGEKIRITSNNEFIFIIDSKNNKK